jgi:hypothetical protein
MNLILIFYFSIKFIGVEIKFIDFYKIYTYFCGGNI